MHIFQLELFNDLRTYFIRPCSAVSLNNNVPIYQGHLLNKQWFSENSQYSLFYALLNLIIVRMAIVQKDAQLFSGVQMT